MAEAQESAWDRQQELLLEASAAKSKMEAAFDAMADGLVITDLEDRLVQANPAYYALRGLEPEQTIGRVLAEISHPGGDWKSCQSCCARREGRHAILLKKPEETCFDRFIEVRVDPIFDSSGRRVGAVEVFRDLTDKRRAEAEAERASALLREIVDAAYDGVYAADLDARLIWGNGRAADLLSRESSSIEGESCFESLAAHDLERARQAFALAARGEAQRFEAQFLAQDGSTRDVLVTNSPIYAEGKVAGVLGIMRDVTEERIAAEQALRSDKLRALGQLAWGVAHNFNNSLTAVLGYTQLSLAKISDPVLKRNLKTVEQAALDAAQMVRRIQNFARQSKDEAFAPADLNQTIRDALDLTCARWRDDARAAGIGYEINFQPASDAVVLCDQSAMREVFVNIIINAVEAMPSGGRLRISTELEENELLINFTDNGSGMTGETRQRIFEPFYTTKGARVHGMGLAVSYGIIERHGGTIEVSSEPGKGTTFSIRLARAPGAKPPSPTPQADARPTPSSILVVDDEAPIRALLSEVLRARGHRVSTAADGIEGLRAIENERFDMVIADLSMPGADGWTVASETRKRWPDTKLVILTGYGSSAELAVPGGDTSAVDALLSKPFKLAEIDITLNRLLATRTLPS